MRTKRKSLIEEGYYGIKKKKISFIKMVEERASHLPTCWVPFLPNDLFFRIFLLLPVKSLLRFACVCKSWYKLIYCAEFVDAYNAQAEATPILLRRGCHERLNTFHVETQLKQCENLCFFPSSSGFKRRKFVYFLEVENGKAKVVDHNISCSGSVVATCNGLVLIVSMNEAIAERRWYSLEGTLVGSHEKLGQLIVINPMTRKLIGLPLGTLPHKRFDESYGLVFSHSKGVYKVVHLFKDKFGIIACEILSLQTRSWKAVDGPPAVAYREVGQGPILALGALHWLPAVGTNCIISMGADDERFTVIDLPLTMGMHDRIVEMGGLLTLVNSVDENHIEVWVLKGLEGTKWVKQHTLYIDAILGYVDNEEYSLPSYALNAKELVFRRETKLYSYDFEFEEIREIGMEHVRLGGFETIMPHSNNLATWEPLEPMS